MLQAPPGKCRHRRIASTPLLPLRPAKQGIVVLPRREIKGHRSIEQWSDFLSLNSPKKSPQSLSSLTCRETAGFSTSRGSNHSTSIARRRRKAYRRESNQGLLTDSGTGHPRRARPARCSISLLQRLVKTGQFSRCSEKVSSSAPLIDTVAPSSSLQTRHRSIAIKRVERKASKKAVARFSLTDSAKGSTQSKSSLSCRKSVAFSVSQGSNHSIPAIRGPRKACRRKTKQVPPTDSGSGPLRRARPARSRDFYH